MAFANDFIGNCSYLNDTADNYIPVAAIRAGTGAFSALCCLAVIAVIVKFNDNFDRFDQRLILYLAIAAFIHSLSYPLARVNYYSPRYLYDDYCYFGGFFNFYSSWVEVLALCCLTLTMLLYTMMGRWPPSRVQFVYLFLMYALPLLWSWVPFLQHTYAATTGWCDLRFVNENCNLFVFGFVARFALWYGPVYLAVFICFMVTLIVSAVNLHRQGGRRREGYESVERPDDQDRDIRPLIWYPITYLILTLFSLANAIDIAIHYNDPERKAVVTIALWYLHVLTSPLRGAFIAIVYAFCPNRPNNIRGSHVQE